MQLEQRQRQQTAYAAALISAALDYCLYPLRSTFVHERSGLMMAHLMSSVQLNKLSSEIQRPTAASRKDRTSIFIVDVRPTRDPAWNHLAMAGLSFCPWCFAASSGKCALAIEYGAVQLFSPATRIRTKHPPPKTPRQPNINMHLPLPKRPGLTVSRLRTVRDCNSPSHFPPLARCNLTGRTDGPGGGSRAGEEAPGKFEA